MTGNEIAKALKSIKGKISVQMLLPNDTYWVYAEKKDLIFWAKNLGDEQSGMKISPENVAGNYYLEFINS